MSPHRSLFNYAVEHVTLRDVADFCPNDPGYPAYVRVFSSILSSKVSPVEANFELHETVNLTRWAKPTEWPEPDRLRRFRIFTNAVGLGLELGPETLSGDLPGNYFGISLLDDARHLKDHVLLEMLPSVLEELHDRLIQSGHSANEAPFLTLGQLILAFMGYASHEDVEVLAARLIEEADRYIPPVGLSTFLWDCTLFNQMHRPWKDFVKETFPETGCSETVSLVRESLLSVDDSDWW